MSPLIALQVGIEEDLVDIVYRYWILKRKAGGNKPLMMARTEQALLLANEKSLETDKEKMKRFISLRQVRCQYHVSSSEFAPHGLGPGFSR